MTQSQKNLTPFEWEVLNAVWDIGGKPTVKNVLEKLYPNGEKAYTTIQTIMNILVEKGYLKKEKIGPVNIYKSLKKRDRVVMNETENFLDKVFGGSFQKMTSFMAGYRDLTEKDIKHLKSLIEKKEKETNGKKTEGKK